ncbi:MAG: Calx-beta domain-containing protein [Candidatus Sumerlaeia bacterium]|nr:Calx-beta domain-containing protein [Candidatus Sumerlaeia bacterium]
MSSSAFALTPSPDGLWQHFDTGHDLSRSATWFTPGKHAAFEADGAFLAEVLKTAPMESTVQRGGAPLEVYLPTPDGGFERFRVWEYQLLAPELAAKYPDIRAYIGESAEGSGYTAHLDVGVHGFKAQVLGPDGGYLVEPIFKDSVDAYVVYYRADWPHSPQEWSCQTPAIDGMGQPLPMRDEDDPTLMAWRKLRASQGGSSRTPITGTTLRTYSLAVATSTQYTAAVGGTVPAGLSAVNTVMNRVNGIYERDKTVRMTLVANNDLLIYTGTDPFSNNVSGTEVNTLESTVASVIGAVDASHLFVTGSGGGIAGGIGNICLTNNSGGMSSSGGLSGGPTGDPFAVDFVAHELGHQFGGRHTFANANECGGMDPPANQEPGSATTIMGYAGICSSENIQPNSDPNFHVDSIERALAYLAVQSCQTGTATGNNPPTANAGANYAIPRSTPFTLTGSGTDPDGGDVLTYSWECRDQQSATSSALAADNGTKPLWRSFPPTTNPSRTFPRISDIINNTSTLGELLPSVNRPSMDFTLTVRDNRAGGGGVGTDSMFVNVVGTAGPFQVTAPNTAVSVTTNPLNVTWDVAGTTSAPISTASVNILLSTDGGNTFPTVLLAGTPNDGAQTVALPVGSSSTARIKVEAAGNVYWDMSNANFSFNITSADSLSINNASLAEGNSGSASMTFTVSLQTPNAGPGDVTVDFATADGTATAGSDYTAVSGTLTFPPSEQFQTIQVPILADTVWEGDETFTVDLSNLAGPATPAVLTGTGTIIEDDPAPTPTRGFAVNTFSGTGGLNDTEGIGAFDPADLEASMAYTPSANLIALSNGNTLLQGGDFFGGDALTFYALTYGAANGSSANLLEINTITGAIESTRTVAGITGHRFAGMSWDPVGDRMLVLLADTTGANASRGFRIESINLATGALTNVRTASGAGTNAPGSSTTAAPRMFGFAIPETAGSTGPFNSVYVDETGATFLYSMTGGVMTNIGSLGITSDPTLNMDLKFDYLTGNLYVSNYDVSADFPNNLYLVNTSTGASTNVGNFDASMNGGNATVSALGFVRPAAGLPLISVGDVADVSEGTDGVVTLSFPVTLDVPNPGPGNVTVDWSLGGTTNTSDFNPPYFGTVTFLPTESAKNIGLSVATDSQFELDETVTVSLANASNAVILDGSGSGVLTNDDGAFPSRWAYGVNTSGPDALVAFDPADIAGTFSRQLTSAYPESFQGGSFAGTDRSTFYAVQFTAPVTLISINTASGARTNIGAVSGIPANHQFAGLAWNAATGQMNALTTEFGAGAINASIHTINLGTGELSGSVALSGIAGTVDLFGIAIPPNGSVYYSIDIDVAAGQPEGLVAIDPASGVATRVGASLGYDDTDLFLQDLEWDTATGTLYRAGFEAGAHIFSSINTVIGARTVISPLDGFGTSQISALGITPPPSATGEGWILR